MGMHLRGAEFQASAKKEGTKAGETAGAAMSQSLTQSLKQGIGVGLGIKLFESIGGAITNVLGGVEDLISRSLGKAGEIERFETQFEVLLGTASEAQQRIEELVQFAATTPFELPEVIQASRTLQVFTQGVLATGDGLRLVGDIAAGTGQPFQEVAMWVGRLYDAMQSGRPFGEATMRLQEMGAISGQSRADIEQLAIGVKNGTLTMTEAWQAAGGEFQQFAGLMDKQSQTLEGQFSNLADAQGQSLAGIGEALLPIAKQVIPEVIRLVQGLGATIAAFITEHAVELKRVILDITNALFGFVSGLFGVQRALGGATAAVGDVAEVGLKAGMGFDEWRKATGNMPVALDKATGSTKAGTDAIDKQIKTVERRIDAAQRQEDAEETRFQRTMKRLSAEYGAQLDALDLQERQLAMAERDKDLSERLRQAKIDLFKAQAQRGADRTAGKADDPSGVVEAQQAVLDAQKAISDEAAQRDRDSQRQRLEGVRTYIENVAQIEAESENKKALAATLEKRRIKLLAELATATEEGKAADIADITARLEAVKTAETRTQQAIRNGDKQSELEKLKAQLAAQRSAISASGSGQKTDNAKLLDDLRIQYQKYLDDNKTATAANVNFIGALIIGKTKAGTGLGGAITKAFTDGQAAGETFRKFLVDTLLPAIQKIVDAFGAIVGALAEIAKNADLIGQLIKLATPGGRLGPTVGTEGDAANASKLTKEFIAKYEDQHGGATPSEAQIRKYLHDKGVPGFARGAWDIPANMLGRLDRGEMVVPQPFAEQLRPAMAGMSGGIGGHGHDIILDGQKVATAIVDPMDEALYYRRR